ncbi:MAG: hypothetical protein HFH09_02665 [Bacilli bacterium]|jgi:hypothetical protein|nr:hypothetical protein [Bacilli bacterium]
MKKKNKGLLMATVALLGIVSIGTAYAGQAAFHLQIPKAQGYVQTGDGTGNGYVTTPTANHAMVYLEAFTGIKAVTFYAGAYSSDGKTVTWGTTGSYIYREDFEKGDQDEVSVPYGYTYGNGQKMGLRARNHNWSLNKGAVTGVVDY